LLLRGIDLALKETEPYMEDLCPLSELDDKELAFAISKIGDIDKQSEEVAVDSESSKYDALSSLIITYVWDNSEEYNEVLQREQANAPTALAS
jgi:hypothetical protein